MSTIGLDGVLSWAQAHHVAATCSGALPSVKARLDEAAGGVLSRALSTLADDPAHDAAAFHGYAVCGEGPWSLVLDSTVGPGEAVSVRAGDAIPHHTDAVLALSDSVSETSSSGSVHVFACDPLSGVPDERARPDFGTGIIRQGDHGPAGRELVATGSIVTPGVLALAAATGHDTIDIVKPPTVGLIVLGRSLLSHGMPREGRVRDALGMTIPSFISANGGIGNPAKRAPDTAELLLTEIDDANVDVIITTGSTEPAPGNHVRQVIGDLNARWLIDGVSVTPGAQMLMARLPDGRILVGLPGNPAAALAGLVTLVGPLLRAMSGRTTVIDHPTGVLIDDAPPADYADDTRLAPVTRETRDGATLLRPLAEDGPAGLTGWARADAVAICPPGAGYRGDVLHYIPLT